MAYLERPNARLFYADSGGDKPVVVFSHGIFMDHSMFDAQVAALEGAFRCVAWDARGHGQSESMGSFTYWDLADDLIALLDELQVERAIFAAMSQGGFLSLRATLRSPQRAAGLFLIDTQAGPEPEHLVPVYQGFLEEWTSNGPTTELAETVASVIVGPADHAPWVAKWLTKSKDYPREPFGCLVGRDDVTDRLPEIEAAVIVVHGEIDGAIPIERAQTLCSRLPNCERLVTIPGAGHAANLSHPDEVNELLIGFCRRHGVR